MRCRDAKAWLSAQRDGDPGSPPTQTIQEHLQSCDSCRTFEKRQRQLESVLSTPRHPSTPLVHTSNVSTDQIMRAIQQQKRITEQLEDIHLQQKTRVARMRTVGAASAALGFFTLSSIPLLFLAMAIVKTDLAVDILALLNGLIDTVIIVGQYLQTGLTLVTRDNLLLSGVAFAVVVMMGMWLRLMRPPQEA